MSFHSRARGQVYTRMKTIAPAGEQATAQDEQEPSDDVTQDVQTVADSWPSPFTLDLFRGWWEFFRLGAPSAVSLLFEWGSYEVNAALAGLRPTQLPDGTADPTQLTTHAVLMQTAALWYMVPMGIALSASTLVGNALGSGDAQEARELVQVRACMRAYVRVWMRECVRACVSACVRACVRVCVCARVRASIRACMCELRLYSALNLRLMCISYAYTCTCVFSCELMVACVSVVMFNSIILLNCTAQLAYVLELLWGLCNGATFTFGVRGLWARLFSPQERVIDYVTSMLPVMWVYGLFDALKCVGMSVLRACARPMLTVYGNITACLLVGYPTSLTLLFYFDLKLYGLWSGMSVAWAFVGALYFLIICRTDWHEQAHLAAQRNKAGLASMNRGSININGIGDKQLRGDLESSSSELILSQTDNGDASAAEPSSILTTTDSAVEWASVPSVSSVDSGAQLVTSESDERLIASGEQ